MAEWGAMTATASRDEQTAEQEGLPMGWASTMLGDVAYINARPDISKLAEETAVSFIPMAAVSEVSGRYEATQSRPLAEVKKGYTPFKNGDIIFAKITPCMENGKSAIVDELLNGLGYGSTEFHVVSTTSVLITKLAFYLLTSRHFRNEAEHKMRGAAGQKRVPPEFLRDYPFPLPPLAEQQRIVAKIEELFSKLDAGVAELKRTQGLLKRYRQSLLHAAVTGELSKGWREAQAGEPEDAGALLARILEERRARWKASGKKGKYVEPKGPDTAGLPELPTGWVWASVEQVGEVQLGRQRSPQHHQGQHMRPYLRVANVYEDRIDTSDIMQMNFTPQEYEIYKLNAGDILLNEGQSLELVGRPAIYRNEVEGACFQNTLIRFRVYHGLRSSFALCVYRTYLHTGRFQKIASWTTSIAHLGGGRFAKMEFPLPPLAEQAHIVSEVERRLSILDNMQATVSAELRRAESTRQSILHRAFSGRLVAQDPQDEPASVLLERIKAEKLSAGAAAIRAKGKRGRKAKSGGPE